MAKIAKPSFSDKAKKARGIDPSDFGKEMARVKAIWQAERDGLRSCVAALEAAIRGAVEALDGGRRGDALKAMRSILPAQKPTPAPPRGPSAA